MQCKFKNKNNGAESTSSKFDRQHGNYFLKNCLPQLCGGTRGLRQTVPATPWPDLGSNTLLPSPGACSMEGRRRRRTHQRLSSETPIRYLWAQQLQGDGLVLFVILQCFVVLAPDGKKKQNERERERRVRVSVPSFQQATPSYLER